MHKVIKGWSSFRAAWFTNIDILEEVYRATRDIAGLVHAIEGPVIHANSISIGRKRTLSIPHLTNDHYSIVMQPVGLSGSDAKPQDEAQFARAAHGCLHGLEALQGDLVHGGVRVCACACVRLSVCLCVFVCVCACVQLAQVHATYISCEVLQNKVCMFQKDWRSC